MMRKLLTSGYFGMGVGICLYANNSKLPPAAYLLNIPFWMFVINPLGSFWNQVLASFMVRKYSEQSTKANFLKKCAHTEK